MKQTASIKTTRLHITSLNKEDNGFILELVNTPGWLKFIGNRNINTAEEASAYIERINNNKNIRYWVVRLVQDETAIGIVTLIKRDHLKYPDIGFAFLPQFGSKGYAYEATKAVLDFILQRTSYKHIAAITVPGNTRSIGLLKKLQFHFERDIIDKEELQLYSIAVAQSKDSKITADKTKK